MVSLDINPVLSDNERSIYTTFTEDESGSVSEAFLLEVSFGRYLYLVYIIQNKSSSDHKVTSLKSSNIVFALQFESGSFVSFYTRFCFLLMKFSNTPYFENIPSEHVRDKEKTFSYQLCIPIF